MSECKKGKNNFDNSQFIKDIEESLKELNDKAVHDEFNFSFQDLLNSDKHAIQTVKHQRHAGDNDNGNKDNDVEDSKILRLLENRNLDLQEIRKEIKTM